jgi:hypothetical protein
MKFVKSEKPISMKDHPKHGEIKTDVEFPQIEGEGEAFWNEFVTFCGGEEIAREMINGLIEDKAKNGGRAALRNIPDDADLTVALAKVAEIVKGYTPQAADGREVRAAKVKAFDNAKALLESGKEFSREELLALFAAGK